MNLHDLDKYTEYLCRFDKDIDANMAYFLFLLWRNDTKSFNKYNKSKRNSPITQLKFELLIDLNYIESKTPEHSFMFSEFEVTNKFLKLVAIDEETAYEELVKYYPKSPIMVNGTANNTINISPSVGTSMYDKIVKNDRLLHNKIIEILIAYTQTNRLQLTIAIKKFIETKHWEFMEEYMKTHFKADSSLGVIE